ncbi:hypothetical protein [Burkholderia diffusa]|uniref:hypothetical protein n=1 Tax=Burkholderia diffusa TaxID=488732 RepID=UPI00157A2F99|nr:hypothetical protein [Burkholderia diffusa]
MLAFTDIGTNEAVDGFILSGFVHRSLCSVNGLVCKNGGKARHSRYERRWDIPAPIGDRLPPARPGDSTPES